MTASTLREALNGDVDSHPSGMERVALHGQAHDMPHRSTRELEAIFARNDRRLPLMGLAIGLTISAGLWAIILAMVL